MMNWHIVTSAQYKAGTKYADHLYFLSDTKEIYRGEVPFTESVILYTELPTEGIALNRLYINSTTLEGKIHNGTTWTTVIQPVADTVVVDGTTPVSGSAVAAYVAEEIEKVTGSGDVVTGLAWDSANHILDITKGQSTETITFEGLGVNLTYDAGTGNLQLVDTKGAAIGDAIKLDLERFVSSGEYDPDTKSIILYFDAEKTQSVTIPVGELVDTYTAEATDSSLNLAVEGNVVKGSVKISLENGNVIEVKEDGLYVATPDISGKMDKDTDAVEGNIAVFDANGNAVDSNKTFDDIIPNTHVYIGATFEEAVNGVTPVKNDVAVVRAQIGETDKYQRIAYIYDGEAWQPMDENYNAENVYFPTDLITTTAIGNVKLTNGQATIAAAGKSLKQVWDAIFIQEKQPSITQPSVSLTVKVNNSNTFAYEAGTTVTPSYTATLNPGKYEFNENNGATGITAKTWTVTDTAGHSLSTNTGAFDAFVVEDNTSYKVTAKADYDASTIVPVTNTGNETTGAIAAGSKSATQSTAITGFRRAFYGTVTEKTEITSDVIRALTGKSTSAVKNGSTFNVAVPVGAVRVLFAYPATVRAATSVKDANASDAQILSAFTEVSVDVEGVDGYTAIPYRVFYSDYANPNDTANTYKVTL